MQNQIAKTEKELETREYTATAGGEAVKITLTGKFEVQSITISEELMNPESKELLEDSILLSINAALAAALKDKQETMNKITQGVKMPGVF